MKISVIIPMYKVEKYIERCLSSVLSQDLPEQEYEIICVDDGSPDKSGELAMQIASKTNNVRVIKQDNGGLSAARNTGIQHAKGEYVMFLDSDDWIESNCLKKIVDKCTQQNLDLLEICAADVFDGKPVRRFSRSYQEVLTGIQALRRGIATCAPFVVYRRSLLIDNQIYFYQGIYHEDNEFSPRAYFYAERVGGLNDIIYNVYQNPSSITRTINPKKAFDTVVVVRQLIQFMNSKVPNEDRDAFISQIVLALNVCLRESYYMEKEDVKRLNESFYQEPNLLDPLKAHDSIIYRIEGLFMRLFPHHVVQVFKFLNMFDPRKKEERTVS